MTKFKLLILVFGILLVVLIGIPILIYLITFSDSPIVTKTSAWGELGDYIGGMLNPIIGIFNIAFLIIISYFVAKWDGDRHRQEFLHGAYTQLSEKLSAVRINALNSETLEELENFIHQFCFNNLFLFEGDRNKIFQERMADLSGSVSSLRSAVDHEADNTGKLSVPLTTEDHKRIWDALKHLAQDTDVRKAFSSFELDRQLMLGFFQRVMLNGDYQAYSTPKVASLRKKG